MGLRQIARLSNQRFACLCCTLENLNWLSQRLNLLIACYSNSLHVISLRLHETMNYHFPDVSKQNQFHFIFLLLLKVLSLVLLKCKFIIFLRVNNRWSSEGFPLRVMKQSDDKRNTIYYTPLNGPVFCDTQLFEGWYRFVTAVGTRTPTTFVDSYKCGKASPGWLTLWLPEAINLLLLPTKSIHYPGNENTQTYQEEVVYLS